MHIKLFGNEKINWNVIFYLWILEFIFIEPVYVQSGRDIRLEQISLEQGLSQVTVNCILQDRQGFMWFGTQDGLNKYDGYQFTVYRHEPNDSTSLSYNLILSIFEDQDGYLWIGTEGGGLNRFNPNTESFIHYKNQIGDSLSLSNNSVYSILEDTRGNLWVGTYNGLNKFDRNLKKIIRYQNQPNNPHSLSHNRISFILEDHNGNLWIGTEHGLNKFEQNSESFISYLNNPDNSLSLSNNNIKSILEDYRGNLWIGTFGGGLNKFNIKTETFTSYQNQVDNPNSLSNNFIMSIFEDSRNNLWIGTSGGGINKLNPESEIFINYQHKPNDPKSLGNNIVMPIFEDRGENLWIGTIGGGLNRFDPKTESFTCYKHQVNNPYSLNNNFVLSIFKDSNDDLWIGTADGLNKFNPLTKIFTLYQHYKDDPHSLSLNNVMSIIEDTDGSLWIGTYGGGLNKFDRKTETFICYKNQDGNPESLSNNFVLRLLKDSEGILWIGTKNGLNRFDEKTETFTHFWHQTDNLHSLSHNNVYSIFEDCSGILWFGTQDGLNKFDRKSETFTQYKNQVNNPHTISHNLVRSIYKDAEGNLWIGTDGGLNKLVPSDNEGSPPTFTCYREKDGLSNDVIYGILEDDNGCLWLSTNKGISKFNPEINSFINYDVKDGLQSNEFNTGSCYKDGNGQMYFGGVNGFNVFHPDSIMNNTYVTPVVITDFLLFNKPVKVSRNGNKSDRFELQKHINFIGEITLDYTDYIFAFEFSALNYRQSEKNQFAYKLEGFNKEWIKTDHLHRRATYTNLPHGEYVFRVIASNDDGYWNEEGTSITLTILPPFWKTWWFRSLIIAFIVGSAFSWYKMRVRNLERQKQKLEKQVKKRTIEIRYKNKQLMEKNNQIQEKNEQILSSIRYGERIQNAILPLAEKIRSSIPEHFIFFKPRDIVSGDFYWFNQLDGKTVLVVVDCTGHGVPGAFMSMIGNIVLNEIIIEQQITNPKKILERLHEEVRTALKQEQEEGVTQDGMDVCLCVLEKNSHKQELLFAGAKRPLYIIKKGEIELIEIKGDRKSIGGRQREKNRVFTSHEIEVQKGDQLYLTTDGFADQQDSKNGRYGSRRLKTFLQSVAELEMKEQGEVLAREIAKHQGREEQRDDITVVGIKV